MEEKEETTPERKVWDLVVVGGGAAGLMAAGTAAREGKTVLLIEKMEKTARKVNITGKGRCNLTNVCEPEEFLTKVHGGETNGETSSGADFFAFALKFFGVGGLMHFFKKQGVKLEIEAGKRVFPEGGKAYEISDALRYWCADNDVVVMLNTRVENILVNAGRVYGVTYINRRGFPRKAECANVLVATGGASYPSTGSEGDGYKMAHHAGHTIVAVRPSLVALRSDHPKFGELTGLRLKNVQTTLEVDGEVAGEEFGEVEFSPRGLDGAAILRLSRRAVDAVIEDKKVDIALDLKAGLSADLLRARIAREVAELEERAFAIDLLRKMLPRNLVYFVAEAAGVDPKTWASKLSAEEIDRLIAAMKRVVFPIVDYGPWEQAIVTAGGVSLAEVDPETLQSRLVRGLYFAGEVLDLDADTGGYNLQMAFSTGRLAAQLK